MIKDTSIAVACSLSLLSCAGGGTSTPDTADTTTSTGTSTGSTVTVAPTTSTSTSGVAPLQPTTVNPDTSEPEPTPTNTATSDDADATDTTENSSTTTSTDEESTAPSSTSTATETSTGEDSTSDASPEADAGTESETTTTSTMDPSDEDVVDTGADDKFSFFVTSYHHIQELSGTPDGFGGDLRYNGAATGLDGADAICQEIGRRVGFGHRTWRAYLSTSSVNAIDRIGNGPWYDHAGQLVANDPSGLTSGDRPAGGCCDNGTYDELGIYHDGKTDVNNDGMDDDDHDTMTATLANGTYAGFSCDDWTSTTAMPSGGVRGGGIQMGHSWPARSGQGWSEAHAGHACAAGTNFIQNGAGDPATVGGGGGYGGIYCFALTEQEAQ